MSVSQIVNQNHSKYRKFRYGSFKRKVIANFIRNTKPSPLRFTILQRLKEVDIRASQPYSNGGNLLSSSFIRDEQKIFLAKYAVNDIWTLIHELFHRTEAVAYASFYEKVPTLAIWSDRFETSNVFALMDCSYLGALNIECRIKKILDDLENGLGNREILDLMVKPVFDEQPYSKLFDIDVSGQWYEHNMSGGFGPILKCKIWWSNIGDNENVRMIDECIVEAASYSAYLRITKKHEANSNSYYGAVSRYIFGAFGDHKICYANESTLCTLQQVVKPKHIREIFLSAPKQIYVELRNIEAAKKLLNTKLPLFATNLNASSQNMRVFIRKLFSNEVLGVNPHDMRAMLRKYVKDQTRGLPYPKRSRKR